MRFCEGREGRIGFERQAVMGGFWEWEMGGMGLERWDCGWQNCQRWAALDHFSEPLNRPSVELMG